MVSIKKTILICFLLTSTSVSYADVLCLKSSQKVAKGAVALSGAITVKTKCPKGYKAILDTSKFVGPQGIQGTKGDTGSQGVKGEKGLQGETGRPAVSYSSCRKVEKTYTYTWNSTTPDCPIPSISESCGENEYLYYGKRTEQFTSDSFPVDGNPQGSSTSIISPTAYDTIFDDSDMFPIGISTTSGTICGPNAVITGTGTTDGTIHLTCCLLD